MVKNKKYLFILFSILVSLILILFIAYNFLWAKYCPIKVMVMPSYIKVDKVELLHFSDIVVVATAEEERSFSRGSIFSLKKDVYTNTIFLIEDYLYNPKNISKEKITMEMMGGVRGCVDMEVDGNTDFIPGQKYLLFLKEKEGNIYRSAVGPWGVFNILSDGVIGLGEWQKTLWQDLLFESQNILDLPSEIKNVISESSK